MRINPELRQLLDGHYVRRGDYLILKVNNTNVSNPPSAEELTSIFGDAVDLPEGFTAIVNDNGAGLVVWLVSVVDGAWYRMQWTAA